MAALFTTPKRNDTTAGTHVAEPDVRRRIGLAHGSWRRVTRRIVAGAVCALTVSSLLMPSVSLAAEWVNVGGTQYNTAAGDEAGTWAWNGADDMKLNGYNGGAIEAAGKLNVSYEGNNTVTNDNGRGIKAKDGANENAELNIQGDASSTLNVTSSRDAITSVGNINIDGAGTVNATSTEHDAIDAGGDVTIKGSGNVNATGDSDGVRADGNITIDNSGTVTAKATDDQGIDANENLIIKGGGKVEASSIKDNAIWADGNIEISGGSQVKASSEEDAAIDGKNSLTVTNASLNASGVGYGIYVYKGITLDGATVTVRASSDGGEDSALFTDEDDIVIKNGSTVDALAEGRFSVAISTSNFYSDEAGGHIYISDSVVKAIARYAETGGDGPDHYSGDQNDEIIPESEGLNIGIFAQTEKGITPATISIVRSKVTAEGDTAAIFALATSADGETIGTIEIEGAPIQTPTGGKIIGYRNKEERDDGIFYEVGQTIGTGDDVIDSPYNEAVAKSTVIAPPEEIKPEEKPGETKPEGSKSEGTKTTKTVAVAATGAKTTGILAATGDASSAAIVAAALAGTAAIAAGAVCALTVSSLLMPSVSLAAEWVKVGGNKYNTAASDEAGTWSWDGADDMKLNGYNGGAIEAAGKLNVNYSGTNIVTAEWIESINVSHGTSENAELNIQGDEGGTLSVTSTEDAILSTGNINIDGAGSVNATSTGFDAINAGGDLAIKGSGNVNATGASDGIRANGNITIDDSGAVTARATKDKGIGTDKNLTIKGDGTVEASSADGEALWSGGNINISDGSQVKASSEKDAAVEAKGSLAATNASLNVNGVEYGVYAHKGITLDHANVTVRAGKGRYGGAIALFTYQDDIVVKNGSTVDAFAEGEVSAAFSTRNDRPNEKGGHIYISDSVVKAIARYVENGDGPTPYSENQDGETSPEPQGENIGIIAQTSEGIMPATISIVRSKVTAEGDTAAIFALAMSADGKAIGTIEIEGSTILTPEGGKVIDYRKLRDGIYEAGQTIGTGDTTVDSLYIKAVAKSTTIAPPEVAKPEGPKPDETKPAESKQDPKPEGAKTTKTVAVATTKAKTTGTLAATGDASGAAIVAAALAGTAAIAAGAVVIRKRS